MKSPPGLGDFIRGTIALYQLSKKLNFELLVDFSEHPSAKFFTNDFSSKLNTYEYFNNGQIPLDTDQFSTILLEHLNNNDITSIETHCFYQNFTPYSCVEKELDKDCIEFIKQKFSPSQVLLDVINDKCLQYNNFNVLHIRAGDEPNKLNDVEIKHIINIITQNLHLINDSPILIMSDYTTIIELLKKYFDLKTLNSHSIHFGSLNSKNIERDIGETLLEFFVMSKAKKIVSLSVYSHVSGFSHMCSKIFEIPFYGYAFSWR